MPRPSEAGAGESEQGLAEHDADLRGWEWHHLWRVSHTERLYWMGWWARLAPIGWQILGPLAQTEQSHQKWLFCL